MKKIFGLFILSLLSFSLQAQNLVLVEKPDIIKTVDFISQTGMVVYYSNDDFIIGSGLPQNFNYKLIDESKKSAEFEYFLIWLPKLSAEKYCSDIAKSSEILYKDEYKLIVKIQANNINKLYPEVHNGLVRISTDEIKIAENKSSLENIKVKGIPEIEEMVSLVVSDSIMQTIQHLEDYGTRKYDTPQAIEAQDWLAEQYTDLGYEVELTSSGTTGSSNVIAIKPGVVFPDQYVVVGGHYDSYTYSTLAPGADDNASGTAGVLEIARILKDYEFNRTIIFCAFTAEEIGLYGSGQWASDAANAGMNIVGYVNLDMTGYLHAGDNLHTDMIAPESAQPLVDLYEEVVAEYVTDFFVYPGYLVGGDSDHTSFNQNGYMGIFPAEEDENYSPYIHTVNDLVGQSVNSPEKAVKFTQAGLATVAVMAEPFTGLYPPMNLTLQTSEDNALLEWEAPLNKALVKYNVYRNDILYASLNDLNQTEYTDYSVSNGQTYEYYVTAVFSGELSGESAPSNHVSTTFGLVELYSWDFETGVQGWTILNTDIGWKWGLQVNLGGNTTEYLGIDSDTYGNGTHVFDYAISPELLLEHYDNIYLNFDYGFRKISTDFLKVLYRYSPASQWVVAEDLTPSENFTNHSVNLNIPDLTNTTQIAFYYDDDNTWAWYAGVDNVTITSTIPENAFAKPLNLTYSTSDLSVELSWDAPSAKSLIGYNVYRDGVLIESITDISTTTCVDNNVFENITYVYFIRAVYDEGESDASNQVTVSFVPTYVFCNKSDISFFVYPNPANDYITIRFNYEFKDEISIEIYNLNGKLFNVSKTDNQTGILNFNINDLPSGVYVIKLTCGNDVIRNKFFKL